MVAEDGRKRHVGAKGARGRREQKSDETGKTAKSAHKFIARFFSANFSDPI
jgi:hypothetical protein